MDLFDRGKPYVIGEKGPELFVPRSNGFILPSAQPAYAAGGGSAVDKGPVQLTVKIGDQTLITTIIKKLARYVDIKGYSR